MQIDTGKMAGTCLKAAALTASVVTYTFWGDWFIIAAMWVLAFPLALLFGLIVGFASRAMGATIVTESSDEDEDDVQEGSVWLSETEFKKSPEIIGKLGEHDIHEWIIIDDPRDPGKQLKLDYSRCVDIENFTPPELVWWAMLPGGLLYVETTEPEKIEAVVTDV